MEQKCRYDYVVEIIETLQKYMDTSSQTDNTNSLIKNAYDAIRELKKIEQDIAQSHKPGEVAVSISSAVEEFDVTYKEIAPKVRKIGLFIKQNKQVFNELKALNLTIEIIQKKYDELKNRKIKMARRVKKINKLPNQLR